MKKKGKTLHKCRNKRHAVIKRDTEGGCFEWFCLTCGCIVN